VPRPLAAGAASLLFAFGAPSAHAIAPPVLTDADLASADAIVVARWAESSGFEDHGEVEGNVRKSFQTLTALVVERSVKGTVPVGNVKMTLGWGLVWDRDGRPSTGSSTELPGDVEDVRKPGLWFLHRRPAGSLADWEPMGFHRSIQPLALEPWFTALASTDPKPGIRAALASAEPVVAMRALKYAARGRWPWPFGGGQFDDWLHGGARTAGSSLAEFRDAIAGALRSGDPEVRARAAVVLDDVDGAKSPTALRPLLEDPDSDVRAVVAGLLATRKDDASYDRFAKAFDGARATWILVAALTRVAVARDPRVVPALIRALETEGGPTEGDPSPALAAREALGAVVGYAFPFTVVESDAAWEEAKALPDPEARLARVRARLGDDREPLVARRVPPTPDATGRWVEIVNRSERPVDVASGPSWVDVQGANGVASWSLPRPQSPEYVRLAPGGRTRMRVDRNDPAARRWMPTGDGVRIDLSFRGLRRDPGARSWMGTLSMDATAK
jgi:hypothetical protein